MVGRCFQKHGNEVMLPYPSIFSVRKKIKIMKVMEDIPELHGHMHGSLSTFIWKLKGKGVVKN